MSGIDLGDIDLSSLRFDSLTGVFGERGTPPPVQVASARREGI